MMGLDTDRIGSAHETEARTGRCRGPAVRNVGAHQPTRTRWPTAAPWPGRRIWPPIVNYITRQIDLPTTSRMCVLE